MQILLIGFLIISIYIPKNYTMEKLPCYHTLSRDINSALLRHQCLQTDMISERTLHHKDYITMDFNRQIKLRAYFTIFFVEIYKSGRRICLAI